MLKGSETSDRLNVYRVQRAGELGTVLYCDKTLNQLLFCNLQVTASTEGLVFLADNPGEESDFVTGLSVTQIHK